jgi:hypothetical protein
MLHGIDGGPILWKLWHPQPDLNAPINPLYYSPFISEKHEAKMRKDMDLSHLPPALQEKLYSISREHCSVFNEKGVFYVPAKPRSCKNVLQHSPKLATSNRSRMGAGFSRRCLRQKPHQEQIKNIDDFVWHFCVNYIPLNNVTRVVAYPIPRCDFAIFTEFSMG